MEVNVVSHKPGFTPIRIELLIETEEELYEMWHRFNLSINDLTDYPGDDEKVPLPEMSSTRIVWDLLDKEVERCL